MWGVGDDEVGSLFSVRGDNGNCTWGSVCAMAHSSTPTSKKAARWGPRHAESRINGASGARPVSVLHE